MIVSEFKDYIPKTLVLPEQLNQAKVYLKSFEEEVRRFAIESVANPKEKMHDHIRDIAKLENRELIFYLQNLEKNNFQTTYIRLDIEKQLNRIFGIGQEEEQK